MLLLVIVLFGLAVLFGAVALKPDELTRAELERRAKRSKVFAARLRREDALVSLTAMMRLGAWVFIILFVIAAAAWLGWFGGLCVSLGAILLYPILTRLPIISVHATKLYVKVEPQLLKAVEKTPGIWKFFHGRISDGFVAERSFASRDELQEAIAASAGILDDEERRLLMGSLTFRDKQVKTVMTPKSVIQSVKKDEFIGPLVLDELHAHGHGRLPVIDGDLDHIIGVLHLRTMLSLDVRKSESAEELMELRVFYVHEEDSLQKVLNQFIKQRHHLFIVVNKHRETVGLVTLEDVMGALIGKNIVDEDDVHEDLRVVASEKAKLNNNSPNGTYL